MSPCEGSGTKVPTGERVVSAQCPVCGLHVRQYGTGVLARHRGHLEIRWRQKDRERLKELFG